VVGPDAGSADAGTDDASTEASFDAQTSPTCPEGCDEGNIDGGPICVAAECACPTSVGLPANCTFLFGSTPPPTNVICCK